MGGFFRVAQKWLLEAVFPSRCVGCGMFGEWWCHECRDQVEVLGRDLCPRCANPSGVHECSNAIRGIDGLVAVGFYHDPKLRSVVRHLKYHHATCMLPSLHAHVQAWADARRFPWPWADASSIAIQPLPATPLRVRQRGYDQAALVAEIVRLTTVPWAVPVEFLARRESSIAQASLEHGPLRSANVAGCFDVVPGAEIPENLLLVDDVLTTGSTMSEAAMVLRAAGAKRVYGFAVAIGA